MDISRLFKPLTIGGIELQHRIAMAPLTRMRSSQDRVPSPLMEEYYTQRASTMPGTLLISESTIVSKAASGGFPRAPGIWSADQIAAWRIITDKIHSHGSYIFCQIFAFGRAATEDVLVKEGIKGVGPSSIPIEKGGSCIIPEAMSQDEIKQAVDDFTTASRNAIAAGFDGVEIHGGNGYLIDQFLQDQSNQRTDEYGGSVANRSLFAVEVLTAVVGAIGAEKVGFRLSPWSTYQGMRMTDPVPQFRDIIRKAAQLNLAYLHVVEGRVSGSVDSESVDTLDFIYDNWKGPIIVAGGYNSSTAMKLLDEDRCDRDVVVAFGRYFISNPDLVFRIRENIPLSDYNRDLFYTGDAAGYVDYAVSKEYGLQKTQRVTN